MIQPVAIHLHTINQSRQLSQFLWHSDINKDAIFNNGTITFTMTCPIKGMNGKPNCSQLLIQINKGRPPAILVALKPWVKRTPALGF